jgi:hypothetical protein
MTLKSSHSATSSPVSEDGVSHSEWQVGQTKDLFGQVAHLVNHSAQQVGNKVKLMSDTLPPLSSISLESVNLQQFLVSRLRQRLETLGSMIYRLTWKEAATPQQWQYYRLAAWAHRTKENECFSWATPLYSDGRGSAGKGKKELPNQAKFVPWSTPTTQDNNQVAGQGKAALHPKRGTTLGGAARQCIAETTSVGKYQLNPRFSLWLMGYPIEWAYCGEAVTQSSRKSQQK